MIQKVDFYIKELETMKKYPQELLTFFLFLKLKFSCQHLFSFSYQILEPSINAMT